MKLARAGVVTVSTIAAAALGVTTASAAPHPVHVKHGTTKVTIAPGVTKALLSNAIAPLVTRPGKPGAGVVAGQTTLTASYPVTGGALTTKPVGGTIKHKGGLKFVNVLNGRSLEVKNFVIDLNKGNLTGAVAGTTTRVPVFKLDLSKATVKIRKNGVDARNVQLKLTATAANALNTTLKTKVFSAGLAVGTADTLPRF